MIDWSRVAELQDEIGGDSFTEVVDIFLTETGASVARLLECSDRAYLAEELHLLKGGVLTIGFVDVAQLCQQGEAMVQNGMAAQVDVAAIGRAYDLACDAFLAQLPQRLMTG